VADNARIICASAQLEEGGLGVRFTVKEYGVDVPAFAVRYDGRVHAYINRCAHVPVQLDWQEGDFFDYSKLYLMCATHGAVYAPDTGVCMRGPCQGQRLKPVDVEERDGRVYLVKEAYDV
jgi:nitrite reductase/ring-hydroxylating ferredoxin subunit